MERLWSWALWAFVALTVLTSVPWVLEEVPVGWLLVALAAAAAALYGRHLRRQGGG